MCDMRRLNLRELRRKTGPVEQVSRGEKRAAPGFPAEHWKALKGFPRSKTDSGRLISEDRDRG